MYPESVAFSAGYWDWALDVAVDDVSAGSVIVFSDAFLGWLFAFAHGATCAVVIDVCCLGIACFGAKFCAVSDAVCNFAFAEVAES